VGGTVAGVSDHPPAESGSTVAPPDGDDTETDDPETDDTQARDRLPRWVPRAILLYFVGLATFGVLTWLIGRLQTLLLDLFVALFLSFALEPLVNRLQKRGWRRGWATAVSFLGLLVFAVVFLLAIGAVVFDQVNQFIDEAPDLAQDAADWVNERFDANVSVEELQEELTREDGPVQGFATRLAGNALAVGASALGILFRLLAIGLFTFYLVADGPKFRRTVCSFLPPRRQRRVLETWEIAIDKTGGYLYSRALLALISALFHWAFFQAIGVPYAAALALFVGLISQFVPTIGTYIAGAMPVLVAVAHDPIDGIWVLAFVVAYQQVENYLFAPRITARTMALHPAVAFATVIAGAALFGAVGALLALPFAAVFQAVGSTYIARHEVIETEMTVEPRRRGGLLRRLLGHGEPDDPPDEEPGTRAPESAGNM
jgi:predicted PurR-regulated permease PerM